MGVLIVGSVALDSVRTPFGEVHGALGGSATYASLAASLFGPVGIVGIVGDDFPGDYAKLLRRHGVDLDGLEVVKGGKTFHWSGYYEYDMNQAFTTSTCVNVFENFHPRIPERYRSSEFLFLGNIDPELQLEVLEQMKGTRQVICDTMNFWISSKREALTPVLKKCDVILMNDGEARQYCDTPNLQKAARELLKLGASRVVIKKGEHGCLMFGRNGFFAAPAYPLEIVKDPTGAGDTFAGGLIGWLARCRNCSETNFRRAIIVGSALASFTVEDFSVERLVRLRRDDLVERCKAFLKASRCATISF
jgi:sugar/nucleoside kinase (ribokinase family)